MKAKLESRRRRGRRIIHIQLGVVAAAVMLHWLTGCPGSGVVVPPGNDGNSTDGNDNGPPAGPPVVRLDVSNTTPITGEEVVLTCSVINDALGTFNFEFEPEFGRLVVSAASGRASFIVDASDVGVALSFTCTATSANGASDPSNSVLITPSQ